MSEVRKKPGGQTTNTTGLMRVTLIALLPGAVAYAWVFGPGVVINLVAGIVFAVVSEWLVLLIRAQPATHLLDGSAVITGALLGLSAPPLLPLWMLLVGVAFALIFGKHLYGGLGENIFNPAMCGFALLILSFPFAMSQWQQINEGDLIQNSLVSMSVKITVPANQTPLYTGSSENEIDGVTGATPLDAYKFRDGQTNAEFFNAGQNDNWKDWVVINFCFLIGGLYLIFRRVIHWRAPITLLGTIAALALFFYDSGSSVSLGSPLFHLFSGATMLAAFFIVTDPVTCPDTHEGVLIFAAGVGVLTFIIRSIGAYPEGIAFAVLLMNACSPLIDQLVFYRRQQL